MECGNDHLIGNGRGLEGGPPVPLPGSALLFVSGLLGMVVLGTRRRSLSQPPGSQRLLKIPKPPSYFPDGGGFLDYGDTIFNSKSIIGTRNPQQN